LILPFLALIIGIVLIFSLNLGMPNGLQLQRRGGYDLKAVIGTQDEAQTKEQTYDEVITTPPLQLQTIWHLGNA
jgi:hypothetical protein